MWRKILRLKSKFPGFISVLKTSSDPARLNAFTLGGLLAVKRNTGTFISCFSGVRSGNSG